MFNFHSLTKYFHITYNQWSLCLTNDPDVHLVEIYDHLLYLMVLMRKKLLIYLTANP